jgi:hypothetical protein
MNKSIAKGTNWIRGLALLGMLVAMVGMLSAGPAAYANTSPICPTSELGKINVIALNATVDGVPSATVAIYNSNGVPVIKGITDANGNFSTYSCVGIFKVKVFAEGYKEYGEVIMVMDNASTNVKAMLERFSPRSAR